VNDGKFELLRNGYRNYTDFYARLTFLQLCSTLYSPNLSKISDTVGRPEACLDLGRGSGEWLAFILVSLFNSWVMTRQLIQWKSGASKHRTLTSEHLHIAFPPRLYLCDSSLVQTRQNRPDASLRQRSLQSPVITCTHRGRYSSRLGSADDISSACRLWTRHSVLRHAALART
jgi:hypothetical protein